MCGPGLQAGQRIACLILVDAEIVYANCHQCRYLALMMSSIRSLLTTR